MQTKAFFQQLLELENSWKVVESFIDGVGQSDIGRNGIFGLRILVYLP